MLLFLFVGDGSFPLELVLIDLSLHLLESPVLVWVRPEFKEVSHQPKLLLVAEQFLFARAAHVYFLLLRDAV